MFSTRQHTFGLETSSVLRKRIDVSARDARARSSSNGPRGMRAVPSSRRLRKLQDRYTSSMLLRRATSRLKNALKTFPIKIKI